jgi:hypothetical protein
MKLKRYRHYTPLLITSQQFRGINRAVYEVQKNSSNKYTTSDFIRQAIDEKLERLEVKSLLKQNKN